MSLKNIDKIKYSKGNIYHESAGGVVFCVSNHILKVALLKTVDNEWVIPKGHIKTEESLIKSALREIREELGIAEELHFIGKIGIDNYKFRLPKDKKDNFKKVHIFSFTVDREICLKPLKEEKFVEAKWLKIDEALNKISTSRFVKTRFLRIDKKVIQKDINRIILLKAKEIFQKSLQSKKTCEKIFIVGGKSLRGTVKLSGSKHTIIPIIVSTLLTKEKITLQNVPDIKDVSVLIECLRILGSKVQFKNNTLSIQTTKIKDNELPFYLTKQMRGILLFLPTLLIQKGFVILNRTGGDPIGRRPIDDYLNPLKKMGAQIKVNKQKIIKAKIKKFSPTIILLDKNKPSPGATKSVIIAGVLTSGRTTIIHASRLPEIIYFVRFLRVLGAKISGEGTSKIIIYGVKSLHGGRFKIPNDRIELLTFISAAGITQGVITIKNAKNILPLVSPELDKFQEIGIEFSFKKNDLIVNGNRNLKGINIETGAYPKFNTDSQPIFAPLLAKSKGKSIIKENIFEKRFEYAKELRKMGADISIRKNRSIIINNSTQLKGTEVEAKDIRGGVALILAGLSANEITIIKNPFWIDRAYEKLDKKFAKLRASIWKARE